MKSIKRKQFSLYRLALFLIVVSLCLAGCSSAGKNISSNIGSSESTVSAAPPKNFEQDSYTTEFVIDRTFAEAVRKNQGLADDTPLTEEFAKSVTELLLWDTVRIKTLTGISHFTSLQWLAISKTDCRDIEELTKIQTLNKVEISWGYIEKIPDFSSCPNLTELRLASNCITDVSPLCKATSLRLVDLSNNNISTIAPIKDVTFLENLSIDGNCITDFDMISDSQPICKALDSVSQSSVSYALETEERAINIVKEQLNDSMPPEIKLARLYAYIIDNVTYDESPCPKRPFG